MRLARKKYWNWLPPLPEKEYLRIVYFGKLQIPPSSMGNDKNKTTKKLKDMMSEIWKVASIFNSTHGISGHLSNTNGCDVAQLIEGKADEIISLMERIRKDPRIVIYKEYKKKVLTVETMDLGWNFSMCDTFKLTSEQYMIVKDDNIPPEQMFNTIRSSYEAIREGWKLSEFYKTIL